MPDKNSEMTHTLSWNASDQANIVKMLSVILNNQKSFGKEVSINDTFEFFKMKLDGKYTANQVLGAIDRYTDQNADIPTPADIIAILSPPKRKITQAEYIAALEWQKNNGYPSYSYEKYLIDDYMGQDREDAPEPMQIADNVKERLRLK